MSTLCNYQAIQGGKFMQNNIVQIKAYGKFTAVFIE